MHQFKPDPSSSSVFSTKGVRRTQLLLCVMRGDQRDDYCFEDTWTKDDPTCASTYRLKKQSEHGTHKNTSSLYDTNMISAEKRVKRRGETMQTLDYVTSVVGGSLKLRPNKGESSVERCINR